MTLELMLGVKTVAREGLSNVKATF